MKMNTTDRSIVLVESINESAHAIIPELDHAAVETRQDPWPLAVEAQTFHSIALRLKLRQHFYNSFPPIITHAQTHTRNKNGEI